MIQHAAVLEYGGTASSGIRRTGLTALAYALGAIIGVISNVSVQAQGLEQGRMEYLTNCAACHGADGKGAGPMSSRLKPRPANLTRLARRNNGVFSPARVYRMIDGREAIGAHRRSEMPIWGCRQGSATDARKRALKEKSFDSFFDLPCDPEDVIQRRIKSVVDYLNLIQEK